MTSHLILQLHCLDQGPKGRAERPSIDDKSLILEARSLYFSALRVSALGTTDRLSCAIALPKQGRLSPRPVRLRLLVDNVDYGCLRILALGGAGLDLLCGDVGLR